MNGRRILLCLTPVAVILGAMWLVGRQSLSGHEGSELPGVTRYGPVVITWILVAPFAALVALELVTGHAFKGILGSVTRTDAPKEYWWRVGVHAFGVAVCIVVPSALMRVS